MVDQGFNAPFQPRVFGDLRKENVAELPKMPQSSQTAFLGLETVPERISLDIRWT